MSELTGRCICGAVAFRVGGPVRDVHHCHCAMCRRATGAAFATLVWTKRSAVEWVGTPVRYRSSKIAVRGFCPTCGTSMTLEYDNSEEIALLIGALDSPGDLTPTYHYGIESRLPWANVNADLPGKRTDVNPQP